LPQSRIDGGEMKGGFGFPDDRAPSTHGGSQRPLPADIQREK
jgi:hypothetical protein